MSTPFRITDNIYMIGGSDLSDPMDCCIYCIDAGELILIDAGAGRNMDKLIDNIHLLGLYPEQLTTVIATHAHIDHIGSLHGLQRRYGLNVIAHNEDASALESGKGVGAEYYGVEYVPCVVNVKLQGEENQIRIGSHEFTILHIPGHTRGSIAVVLNTRSDTVLFGQDIHGPYLSKWGGELSRAKISLKKLQKIHADILCEGHYGVIKPADEVDNFIQEFIEELERTF